jgi:hypothetical protein
MKKIFFCLATLPIYIITGFFVYWYIISFFPPETVNVIGYTERVKAGYSLEVRYQIKTHRACSYQIYRELEGDRTLIPLAHSENYIPEDTAIDGFLVKVLIPDYVTRGLYNYVVKTVYVCNMYDQIFSQRITLPKIPIIVY